MQINADIPPLKVSGILVQEDRWTAMQRERDELRTEVEYLRTELADALCETCKHPWRYHTSGGMCSGSADYIECYCSRISPL